MFKVPVRIYIVLILIIFIKEQYLIILNKSQEVYLCYFLRVLKLKLFNYFYQIFDILRNIYIGSCVTVCIINGILYNSTAPFII